MRRSITLVFLATWVLACAGERHVPTCQERLVDSPPPPDACLQQAEGRAYLQQVAGRLVDSLMSWRSSPGSAEVTLGFNSGSGVETVCLGPTQGAIVSARAGSAAASLRALPPGPACLSNRRLVLAWESPVVTHEEISAATLACQPDTFRVRNKIAQCRLTEVCSTDDVVALEGEREDVLSACVLQQLPLTLAIPSAHSYLNFLPMEGRAPSKQRALMALLSCAEPADEPALVACMQEHGWARTE